MISYNEALIKLSKSKLLIKSEKILLKNSLYRICSENIYSKYDSRIEADSRTPIERRIIASE